MKKILIVGAGRLGKGFMAETFDNAGWEISFLDKDPRVVEALRDGGSFTVTVHREDRVEERTIVGCKAYGYDNARSAGQEIVTADVIALTLYPEDFADAIQYLAPSLIERSEKNAAQNLDILCLTNKNYLMETFDQCFVEHLKTEEAIAWFRKHVSLRDTIIRRATDADDNASLKVRTTAVLSLLIQGPLLVSLDDVEWMETCDKLELLKDLKVFMVNGPHVTGAFIGHFKGYKTLNQTVRDPQCLALIQKVRDEIFEGILRGYPVTKNELDHLSIFPQAKGEMEDYLHRIAYDPIRKLARHDRLTGIAHVCMENGVEPDGIAQAIAYGIAYNHPDDPQALQIQADIKANGIDQTIEKYCGIKADSPLFGKIKAYYEAL